MTSSRFVHTRTAGSALRHLAFSRTGLTAARKKTRSVTQPQGRNSGVRRFVCSIQIGQLNSHCFSHLVVSKLLFEPEPPEKTLPFCHTSELKKRLFLDFHRAATKTLHSDA